MSICPDCGQENIKGVDVCEGCGQSIDHLSFRVATSTVELALENARIKNLPPRAPLSVDVTATVEDVIKKLASENAGCAIVTKDDQVVGIFSERDALMQINTDFKKLGSRPITDFMTANPVTLEAKNKVAFAIQKMDQGGYRHIPIMNKGELVGIISVRDILDYLTEQLADAAPV